MRGLTRRILVWLFAGIGGLVAITVIAALAMIFATMPNEGGTVHLPGLAAPVTVGFGSRGVPFIKAANRADAAEALGYVHARSRLFEMDLMRRAGKGKLAAWFGRRALFFDEHMRIIGLLDAAKASEGSLTPRTRALLAAYARGVNARIAQCGRLCGWQYLIFGRPKPWRIVDSLLWGELLADELSGNADLELTRLRLLATLPPAKIASLWPGITTPPPDFASTAYPAGARGAARQALARLTGYAPPFRRTRTESNEFAVGAARSATGAPLLAGDPHLGFQYPSLWYLARIDTPGETLAGATAPGVPFLIFGHNRRIAWTFTNNGAAAQDIFVFKRLDKAHYQGPDGPLRFGIRHETIRVSGQKPVDFTIRTTMDGPVIATVKDSVLALKAVNLTHDNHSADGLNALDAARSLTEAETAAGLITTPVQNLLAASRRRIGLIVTGCVPRRASGDGGWPINGGRQGTGWTGLACGDALPRFIAPPGNVLVNTNEQVAPPGFPVPMGPDQFGDWRSVAIRRDLARHAKLTVKDFIGADYGISSVYAAELLPRLAAITPRTTLGRRAMALLRGWNGRMARDLPQPLIFNAWLRQFRLDVLARNHVPSALAGPAAMQFIQALLTAPKQQALWCGGSCAAVLATAADTAMAALARQHGANPNLWRWGRVHRAIFLDPMIGAIPLLGRWLLPSISVPGDGSTVDRSASGSAPGPASGPDGWTAVLGPSYRGIYDLADLNRSRFTMAPGQSGDIFSPHARDFLQSWRDGRMITLPKHPARLKATLILQP
jgi:penicillin amidase